jgi:hypothetical protein
MGADYFLRALLRKKGVLPDMGGIEVVNYVCATLVKDSCLKKKHADSPPEAAHVVMLIIERLANDFSYYK